MPEVVVHLAHTIAIVSDRRQAARIDIPLGNITLGLKACTHEPAAQSGRIVAFKPRADGTIMSRCSLICLCGKEAEA